jgi:hypothetical protein
VQVICFLTCIMALAVPWQAQVSTPKKTPEPAQHPQEITVLKGGARQLSTRSGVTTPLPQESTSQHQPGIGAGQSEEDVKLAQAQAEYDLYSLKHARDTFEWQYFSGKIIFWVVLLLVGVGVVFSSVQFYVGLRPPRTSVAEIKGTPGPGTSDPVATEFEATLHGIKLKSSVLGLLILAVSLVFFYLYLIYVYPITNVEDTTHPPSAATKKMSE